MKQGMVKNAKRLRPQTVDSEVRRCLVLTTKNNNFRNLLQKSLGLKLQEILDFFSFCVVSTTENK